MIDRSAHTHWKGRLKDGEGELSLESGAYSGPYSFQSRMADAKGTNPEELIGAAQASCFSMALSMVLEERRFKPESIETDVTVSLDEEMEVPEITGITVKTVASVPEIDEKAFQELADASKTRCPVSKILDVPITLEAKLK